MMLLTSNLLWKIPYPSQGSFCTRSSPSVSMCSSRSHGATSLSGAGKDLVNFLVVRGYLLGLFVGKPKGNNQFSGTALFLFGFPLTPTKRHDMDILFMASCQDQADPRLPDQQGSRHGRPEELQNFPIGFRSPESALDVCPMLRPAKRGVF